MAKINFPTLFQTSLREYKFFFIFGNDTTVFERSISFLEKKISFPLNIKTEADLLSSSFLQPSLFDNPFEPSLTLVQNITDRIATHIENLKEGFFIFTSEKARAQSKLATYFANSPQSLAIAAYGSPLLLSEFNHMTEEMTLSRSFKEQLFKAYKNDYRGLKENLEKIKLFGDVPETYCELFLDTSSVCDEFTLLRNACLLKDEKKIVEAFFLILPSDLISFLRILTRSFLTLYELKISRPPLSWQKVFFKDQPLFEAALSYWEKKEIQIFLEGLLALEKKVKHSTFLLPQVFQSLLKMFHVKQLFNSKLLSQQ